MPFDFLDPNQVNDFRTQAKTMGRSTTDTERYINSQIQQEMAKTQLGLDIGKQQVDTLKLNNEMMKLSGAGGTNVADLSESDTKMYNSLTAAKEAKALLEQGLDTGPLKNIGAGISSLVGKTSTYTDYKSKLALATSALKSALLGGAQTDAELKGLADALPKAGDQEAIALQKLNNFISLYGQKFGIKSDQPESQATPAAKAPGLGITDQTTAGPQQTPGIGLQPEAQKPPAFNIKGEVAQPGDLMLDNATGEMSLYGKPGDKGQVFKKTPEGGEVENGFIKWLADSNFLPIVGGVLGTFAGAGIASVGTGAAGAAAGKAMQQGLRELVDPDRQDLSDMAKAVIVEGATDAILGGAFFGVGHLAGKGLKVMFGEGAEAALKGGAEAATVGSEEAAQVGGKSLLEKQAETFTKKGLGLKTKAIDTFRKGAGGNLVEEAMAKGYGSLEEAAKISGEEGSSAVAKLKGLLEGQSAKTDDVIKLLQDVQYKVANNAGEVSPALQSGVNQIDDWIKHVASYGDEISGTELNTVKRGLQEAFGSSMEVAKGSKRIVQEASSRVKSFIEDFHPEIKGTNRDILFNKLINEASLSKLDNDTLKSMWQFSDLIVGAANPTILVGKKSADLFLRSFDDVAKAKIINSGLQYAVSQNNRLAVRNILRLAMRAGASFGAAAGASAVSQAVEPQQTPGLNLQPSPMSSTAPGLGLDGGFGGGGGSMPRYMYR